MVGMVKRAAGGAGKVSQVVIIGCGGHGKVIADIIESRHETYELLGFVDRDGALWGSSVWDYKVLGGYDFLLENIAPGEAALANGVGSAGDTRQRRSVFEKFKSMGYSFCSVKSPFSYFSARSAAGEGFQLMAGAVVNPACSIGNDVIINTNASVDHDCVIGDHAHISPGAALSGSVSVGEGTHIGTGASVKNGVAVGVECLVAAGAVVISDIPSGCLAMGVPAKIKTRRA
jgi:UDP-perosamine 4-acetyltransferase